MTLESRSPDEIFARGGYGAKGSVGFLLARVSLSHCFHSGVWYGHFSSSMHHSGGSGSRKAASRRARVRQRGMPCLASSTNACVVGKTPHSRAVLSLDAATTCRPSGLNAALLGEKPPENITLHGAHDFNSGGEIGSVSAASSAFSAQIGKQFKRVGNTLTIG
jgi:hypothetical protein